MRTFVSCVMMALSASAGAQVVNGSFENPNLGFRSVGPGQTYGGWTGSGPNDIEFVHTVPTPSLPLLELSGYDGQYWIDLCGVGAPSGLYQMVTTTAGQQYDVSFAMSANVWGPPAVFHMNVLWNGAVVGTFSKDTTGLNGAFMNWTVHNVIVTGTGLDRLEFMALTGINARGPAIDDVRMNPVPAPAAAVLLGVGTLLMSRRRR